MAPKTVAAGVAVAGILAGGGSITADKMIDPYTQVGTKLEIAASSTIPEAGIDQFSADTTQPKITLKKFNGEVAMGVTYDGIQATGARPFLSKNVEWKEGAQTMQVVPLDKSTTLEDGGYEINIILDAPPASNVFNFSIDGADNLDFFYQAPLWQEAGLKEPTKDCTDTDCLFPDGQVTRPSEAVGSFAVYYRQHSNHIEGSANYATGKVYQIFRPKVTDATGKETWADLSYTNGILSVSVPQAFLDSATYPVTVDPTFGYTTQGASNISSGLDTIITMGDTFLGAAGTGVSMSVYAAKSSVAVNVQMAVYDTGVNLITNSNTNSVSVDTANWYTATDVGTPTFTAVQYYLCINSQTNPFLYYFDSGTNGRYLNTQAYGSWPASLTLVTPGTARKYSIYATYTASGGGTTPTVDQTYFEILSN